jgi:hypothetical protein
MRALTFVALWFVHAQPPQICLYLPGHKSLGMGPDGVHVPQILLDCISNLGCFRPKYISGLLPYFYGFLD